MWLACPRLFAIGSRMGYPIEVGFQMIHKCRKIKTFWIPLFYFVGTNHADLAIVILMEGINGDVCYFSQATYFPACFMDNR